MVRRRFMISLDDSNFYQPGIAGEVIFVLRPVEAPGKLFETTHPIIWKVFDIGTGHSRAFDYDTQLAFSTVKKRSNGCIEPVISRIVPTGQLATLAQDNGLPAWGGIHQWQDDSPTSIAVQNRSRTDQAFAVCTSLVEENSCDPTFAPILLFNKIPHGQYLQVKADLRLEAYYGCGQKVTKQVHAKDLKDMQPILNERGCIWSVILNELPKTSSWSLYQQRDGRLCMRESSLNDSSQVASMTDLKTLKEKIGKVDQCIRRALGDDFLGVAKLQRRIAELESKTSELRSGIGSSTSSNLAADSEVTFLREQVQTCLADVSRLKSSKNTRATLVAGIENVANSVNDVARLRASISRIEDRMKDFDGALQGVSAIQEDVNKLGQCYEQVQDYIAVSEESMVVLHQGAVIAAERVDKVERDLSALTEEVEGREQEIKRATGSIEAANARVADIGQKVERIDQAARGTESKIRKIEADAALVANALRTELQRKANVNDVEDKHLQTTRSVQRLERTTGDVQSSLQDVETKCGRMTFSIGDIDARLTLFTARAGGTEVISRDLKQLDTRLIRVEEVTAKLETDTRSHEGKIDAIVDIAGRNDSAILDLRGRVKSIDELIKKAKTWMDPMKNVKSSGEDQAKDNKSSVDMAKARVEHVDLAPLDTSKVKSDAKAAVISTEGVSVQPEVPVTRMWNPRLWFAK